MKRAQAQTVARDLSTPWAATADGAAARRELLAALPVAERRLTLAGISTAVLEGGSGPPLLLLHGPMGYAAHWLRIIPGLVTNHRVIAPDLPGHGASDAGEDTLDADRAVDWLAALIEQTCDRAPDVVAQLLGGAIALRFAARHGDRLRRLVLIDTFGLGEFQPTPEFGRALAEFQAQPEHDTHQRLWRRCAFDLDTLRRGMVDAWAPFEAYNLDRARTPGVQSAVADLMQRVGVPAIPAETLARIAVPTTLIWGAHDLATSLSVAEAASARWRWPLTVIGNCGDDPPIEQPKALLDAVRAALGDLRAPDRGA